MSQFLALATPSERATEESSVVSQKIDEVKMLQILTGDECKSRGDHDRCLDLRNLQGEGAAEEDEVRQDSGRPLITSYSSASSQRVV